ncbi:MAG: leucyl aminopeptidase [Bacteroidia bacterium]|nr:leucyl aminopeptidase [Bacteroidia bacterium]MCZ2278028.1 leucyl aminopeptidase [Bacteroidia bacterium]
MNAIIKRQTAPEAGNHVVILIKEKKKLDTGFFTAEELDFIHKSLNEDNESVTVNQYRRTVTVQLIKKKKQESAVLEAMRKAGDRIATQVNKLKGEILYIQAGDFFIEALALAEGAVLGNYQFLKYRTQSEKERNTLKTIAINSRKAKDENISQMNITCEAVCRARDLVNEPQNSLNSEQLASAFRQMGKQAGLSVEVLNKSKIEKLGMGGLLAVNKGSVIPPTFTIMEWKPSNAVNSKPYVLVGKGVVYDTGGLSLKPTANSMEDMKCDMSGAATVGCTLVAVAKMKLPLHVVGLIPSTDNRPGGDAYTPGDVITMYSGKTVEVLNTDAEGRMILADALHYAKQYNPKLVLEFSTLTGSAAVAIGSYGIVFMGNADSRIKEKLNRCAEHVYERLVEFPFWDEYDELIKSDIADIKNIGGRDGGAITAGKFLAHFTDYPFVHFDIAGPAFVKRPDSYRGKYATGVGVRLLISFLQSAK